MNKPANTPLGVDVLMADLQVVQTFTVSLTSILMGGTGVLAWGVQSRNASSVGSGSQGGIPKGIVGNIVGIIVG